MNDEIMNYMLSNIAKTNAIKNNVVNELSEKEALDIFNQVINIYKKYNLSYQCACRVTLALNHAFLTGAVELYNQDI